MLNTVHRARQSPLSYRPSNFLTPPSAPSFISLYPRAQKLKHKYICKRPSVLDSDVSSVSSLLHRRQTRTRSLQTTLFSSPSSQIPLARHADLYVQPRLSTARAPCPGCLFTLCYRRCRPDNRSRRGKINRCVMFPPYHIPCIFLSAGIGTGSACRAAVDDRPISDGCDCTAIFRSRSLGNATPGRTSGLGGRGQTRPHRHPPLRMKSANSWLPPRSDRRMHAVWLPCGQQRPQIIPAHLGVCVHRPRRHGSGREVGLNSGWRAGYRAEGARNTRSVRRQNAAADAFAFV